MTVFIVPVIQLLLLVVVIWLVVRLVSRHRTTTQSGLDSASMVGQAIVAVLTMVALVLTISGLVSLSGEIIHSLREEAYRSNSGDLARDIAFVVIGAPVVAVLLRRTVLRLHVPEVRLATPWMAYLHAALVLTFAGSMVTGYEVLHTALGDRPLRGETVAAFVIWAAAWSFHWFVLRAKYPPRGDLYLAVASAAGLVMLSIGAGGLLARGIALVYRPLAHQVEPHGEPMVTRTALTSIAVGGAAWAWHWLVHYRHAERTTLWNGHVILVGGLGGLASAIVSVTLAGYWSLVWFFGDSPKPDWAHHFSFVPATIATAVVGVVVFSYHWFVVAQLGRAAARTEPVRVFEYLSAGAGLVAAAIGIVHVVVATVESFTAPAVTANPDSPNRWIAAISLLGVGVPVWLVFWRRIQGFVARDRSGEMRSAVRPVYLMALFGVGGAVAMIGVITTVTQSLRDLLDGTFGEQTIRDVRVPVGMLVAVSGLAWYHLRVYRAERAEHVAVQVRHDVIVVSSDEGIAERLAAASGAHVVQWYRADEVLVAPIDVDELARAIADNPARHLLVVQGPDEVEVVPFDEHHPVPG